MDTEATPADDGLEALEYAQRFAHETGIDVKDSRACIASLFYGGRFAKGTGRKPGAFVLALELKILGLSQGQIMNHLESYTRRCAPPVPRNELEAVLRSAFSGMYDKRYSCHNLQLAPYCIGSPCPHKPKNNLTLKQQCGPTAFVANNWLAYISPAMSNICLALLGIRVKRGLDPDAVFRVTFEELTLESNISKSSLERNLKRLKEVGLLKRVTIGSSWGSEKRQKTEVEMIAPIPNPIDLGLTPQKLKNPLFS